MDGGGERARGAPGGATSGGEASADDGDMDGGGERAPGTPGGATTSGGEGSADGGSVVDGGGERARGGVTAVDAARGIASGDAGSGDVGTVRPSDARRAARLEVGYGAYTLNGFASSSARAQHARALEGWQDWHRAACGCMPGVWMHGDVVPAQRTWAEAAARACTHI